jgi:translation initiation factor IF-2
MSEENKKENPSAGSGLMQRPPVIVVMGHIDHGKSTLLDYIRNTNTTEKEAGGITQHISAYEVEVNGKRMTFLDTPGHEAFGSLRARGAKVADIAILVVSAEDGVKPQTVEALNCIKKDSIPFIIALNKIDRPGANVDKVKQDLAEHEVLVEGWGGTVPTCAISAKTGEGVSDLLELISLQADLEDLKGDSAVSAEGFVLESSLNPKQGIGATIIIKNGSFKVGMFAAAEGAFSPIRAIENYKGENLKEASFSSPVRIAGWNKLPIVGSQFKTFDKKDDAAEFSSKSIPQKNNEDYLNAEAFFEVVVKADTFGSLDAIEHELKKLGNEKIRVKVISKGIGAVTENDIKAANIKKCLVLAFNVSTDRSAAALALREGVEIKTYNIIYELVDYVAEKIKQNTPVETKEIMTGSAKILKIFSKNKDKQVLGARVEEGEMKSGSVVKILRRDAEIGSGKIRELQAQKIKTNLVKEGQEFGMMIESKTEIAPGDVLKATQMVKQ